MSDEKVKIVKSKYPPHEGIRIEHLWFTGATQFPGALEDHITCKPDEPDGTRCYTASYHPTIAAFEVRCYIGGDLNDTRYIPREHVKQYRKVEVAK